MEASPEEMETARFMAEMSTARRPEDMETARIMAQLSSGHALASGQIYTEEPPFERAEMF